MMMPRLAENLLLLARSYGEQVSVVDSEGSAITYNELISRVVLVRDFLRANGIKSGSRVVVLREKSIECIVAILAALECGATYIPADPSQSVTRIRFILEDCDPEAVLLNPNAFPSDLPCQLDICAAIPGMTGTVFTRISTDTSIPKLAYILYTSGSTGKPKGVCVSDEAAQSFVDWSMKTFQLRRDDRVASIAPFHFDLSVFDLYATLLAGATLHLFSPEQVRNPRMMAQLFSERNISVIYATPSFFTTIIEFGKPGKQNWDHLRLVMFAGEVFPVKQLHALMDVWNQPRFFNLFGPTETNVCTWTEIHKEENRTSPYPIGLPCTGHEHEISDEGELYIGGPHVAEGYLNNEELTRSRFFIRNGMRWFKTGDLVMKDNSGQLIYKGRIDRMIKRRGYRIEPAEVEQALMLHPAINSAAVVSMQGDHEMPVLVAFVTGRNVPGIIEVKEFLLKHIPDYMLPDAVKQVEMIPTTANGKVDYQHLRQLFN